jgi:hypothetical protein
MWIEQRVALAVPRFQGWAPVEAAYTLIDAIRRLELTRSVKGLDPISPPDFRTKIATDLALIESGRDALRAFGKVPEFKDERFEELGRGILQDAEAKGWQPSS